MQDRRSTGRWRIKQTSDFRLEEDDYYEECQIRDINYKGLRLALKRKLSTDTYLNISLKLTPDSILKAEVWVAWHRVSGENDFYGLVFTKIRDSDKASIYEFVRKYFPESIYNQWWQDSTKMKGGEDMSSNDFEDKRIFARLPVEFPLKFLNLGSNKEGYGQAQDISAKGLGMVTHDEFSPNTTVEFWLQIPDRGDPLYTRGEVIWSKRLAPNKYQTGVNLDRADLMGMSRAYRAV
jgi:hypothetical protein